MEIKRELKEISWQEVRSQVIKVSPQLSQRIDEISPIKDYPLFKATYLYGDEILRDGKFNVPSPSGGLALITDIEVTDYVREHLGYNLFSNPVCLILSKSLELFLPFEERTIPLYGISPVQAGMLLGISRVLNPDDSHHPAFLWGMTAGARSIFMLPKISDVAAHHRIQKTLCIRSEAPKRLLDHWGVFRDIANSSEVIGHETWSMEILFFSKKWFAHLKDPAWLGFYNYLLEKSFLGSEFWRSQFVWDLAFSMIRKIKNIKSNAYIADSVKHLLSVSTGSVPGFSPALNNEAGPIDLLQKVYTDIYKLKDYLPTIIQPAWLSRNREFSHPVYYSLSFPTALEFSPKTNLKTSNLTDLCMIRSLMTTYLNEISSNKLNIAGTPYYKIEKEIEFNYFHSDTDIGQYHEIKNTALIPLEDPSFLKTLVETKNKSFPHDSPLIKGGCIKIELKKQP